MQTTDLYLSVREKEGRLYPDDLVRELPVVPSGHPLFSEWQARSSSCDRLTKYVQDLSHPVTVLDVGCGNGWLANRIAATTRAPVVGVDINFRELRQAQRVFADRSHLHWVIADADCAPFKDRVFDVIVAASVIQYFADLPAVLRMLIRLLGERGEIHILDSPLYSVEELPAARERSRLYYSGLGLPEMAAHYHHHSVEALAAFRVTWLYVPGKAHPGATMNDSPFPWVRLRPAT